MFFKIESWNFQNLFEKEFRETSQNFNSIRQPIEKMKITIVWMSWMSWNFVRFHEILFQTAFYLEKQKSFIPKKIFFKPLSISKQKIFVYWPNFQWRFWSRLISWQKVSNLYMHIKNDNPIAGAYWQSVYFWCEE